MSFQNYNQTKILNIINNTFSIMKLRDFTLFFYFIILIVSVENICGNNYTKFRDEDSKRNLQEGEYDTFMILNFKADCNYSNGF